VVLEGLKRLEYRGYDSAGLAVVNGGLEVFRAPGKIAVLERELGSSCPKAPPPSRTPVGRRTVSRIR
jgi:glucosamine 6-phosphate synthetase-like amidotransferase/phosphosugar isomerase protein